MRSLRIILALFFLPYISVAQLHYALEPNTEGFLFASKPRLLADPGIPFNIVSPFGPLKVKKNNLYLETGLFYANAGLSWVEDASRKCHRATGFTIPIRFGFIKDEIKFIGISHYFTYNIYYKQKTVDTLSGKTQVLVKEFGSDHIRKFYPAISIDLGLSLMDVGRFSVRLKYYYLNFFNRKHTEQIEGMTVKPYESIDFKHFAIVIGYNPGL
ncbi:MAG: hypothetical protein KKA07_14620 [Bacteroidetes bacterium]|nr:hypothetical protein [Bacteroidota bacterium]MBU1720294.1 hypothetical protein [Bacteroidota bacterium]